MTPLPEGPARPMTGLATVSHRSTMTSESGSGWLANSGPAADAAKRGWELYQSDGYWYVNERKVPINERRPVPPDEPETGAAARAQSRQVNANQLGSGATPAEAMSAAVAEWDRREEDRAALKQAAEEQARLDAEARDGVVRSSTE